MHVCRQRTKDGSRRIEKLDGLRFPWLTAAAEVATNKKQTRVGGRGKAPTIRQSAWVKEVTIPESNHLISDLHADPPFAGQAVIDGVAVVHSQPQGETLPIRAGQKLNNRLPARVSKNFDAYDSDCVGQESEADPRRSSSPARLASGRACRACYEPGMDAQTLAS